MDEKNRVDNALQPDEAPGQGTTGDNKAKGLLGKAGESLKAAGGKLKELGGKAVAPLRVDDADEDAPADAMTNKQTEKAPEAQATEAVFAAGEPEPKAEERVEAAEQKAPEQPTLPEAPKKPKPVGRKKKKKLAKTAVMPVLKPEAPQTEAEPEPQAAAIAPADTQPAPPPVPEAPEEAPVAEPGGEAEATTEEPAPHKQDETTTEEPAPHKQDETTTEELAAPEAEQPAEPEQATEETIIAAALPPETPPEAEKPKKAKRKRKKRRRASGIRVFGRMILNGFKFLFVLLCMAVISVCVVAVGLVNYVVAATQDDDELLDLESRSYSQTSYILYQDAETGEWLEYQELISASEHRIWVDYSDIPQDMIHAIVATEDREFFDHHGVSFSRTVYAALNEVFEMRSTFGASTIDQQVVKNLTGDDGVDYLRKLREMFRAWGLNNRYSKDMIIEVYLNTMGLSEKIVGVGAGARMYFNKDISELNLWECATIAGITQAPTYYSPIQNPENTLKRRNDVLYFMWECEYITDAEYQHAVKQPLGLDLTEQEQVVDSIFSYFTDQVFNEVLRDLQQIRGMTAGEAYNYIYTGGLRIYATVDMQLQTAMEELYYHAYDEDGYLTTFRNQKTGNYYKTDLTLTMPIKDADGNVVDTYEQLPQSAAASVRYDGSLAAVVGGIGEKETSLTLNRATQSERQTGSTMKPIGAYALGIDMGLVNWASMYNDSPVMNSDPNNKTGDANWPKNATQRYRNYNVPIVTAVAESINTIAVRVASFVGVPEIYSFLEDTLQISTLVESDMAISPMALGALTNGMTAYELAGAYAIFGGEDTYGIYNSLHSYYYVEDSKGSVVLRPNATQVQAISEETGYIMNRLLAGVFGDNTLPGNGAPTARGMKPEGDMDAVAKTGTTSNDADRWFVGLTPYYVTAVWWGYDVNPENPENNPIYRRWTRSATGNVTPNLWKTLMEMGQEGLEYKDFPDKPENVVQQSYCTVSGRLAGPGCPTATGYFNVNDDLLETCNGHSGVVNSHITDEG